MKLIAPVEYFEEFDQFLIANNENGIPNTIPYNDKYKVRREQDTIIIEYNHMKDIAPGFWLFVIPLWALFCIGVRFILVGPG